MPQSLRGIWSPMPTPLTEDGSVSKNGLNAVVDFLLEGGIDGLFPLGTDGEFALLRPEERRMVVETVVDRANGKVPVFAGVSDPSTENVLHFSAEAKDLGADGVVATPPYYFSTTNDALYRHFKLLSEKIDLPLVLYNIPDFTHVFVPHEVVNRLADERVIVGMKYTEYNFLNLLRFDAEVGAKISVFTGSDAMAYTNLEFGGSGAVIGISNVAPQIASRLFDEFEAGNLKAAMKDQLALLPLIRAIGIGQVPAGLKEAMRLIGMPVGPPKEPLPRLSPEELLEVKALLKQAGINPME